MALGNHDSLINAVKHLKETGKFSDFVIKCQDDVYKVHKAIICPQSDFFDKAVAFGKEAVESEIDLKGDEPEIVRCMVEFLYTSNYEAKHEPDLVPHRITWKVPTLNNMEKAKARQIAEMVAILKPESYKDIAATVVAMSPIWYTSGIPYAKKSLSRDLIDVTHKKIVQARKAQSDYKPVDLFPSDSVLVTHAKVYALADKYNISGLKVLACSKFRDIKGVGHFTSVGFHEAIDVVFTTTPDTDVGLRAIVAKLVTQILEKLGMYPRLEEKLQMFPELGIQMLSAQYGDSRAESDEESGGESDGDASA